MFLLLFCHDCSNVGVEIPRRDSVPYYSTFSVVYTFNCKGTLPYGAQGQKFFFTLWILLLFDSIVLLVVIGYGIVAGNTLELESLVSVFFHSFFCTIPYHTIGDDERETARVLYLWGCSRKGT